jgi:hypothetical protein
VAGVCNPATGVCTDPLQTDGVACDLDASMCTPDACNGGTCMAGAPVDCDDGNTCTDDSCDPATGLCSHDANQDTCEDGDPCTVDDTCLGGACQTGTPVDCDDQNACTDDSCDPESGLCVNDPNSLPCDDGDACTTGDTCAEGWCQPGVPTDCDDRDPCTTDWCDPVGGDCVREFNTDPCDDNDPCTADDACLGGACQPGAPVDCDDGDPCTTEACNPGTGDCDRSYNTEPCDDGDACTTGDACSEGSCLPGAPKSCDDENPCTDDQCDPMTGECANTDNTEPCDDGDPCTEMDACAGGACQAGTPKWCDDGNACTDDYCDAETGECATTYNEAGCDDGDLCTDGDYCFMGACQPGLPRNCDDGNPCTDDACDPWSGCFHAPNEEPCDDGNRCTDGDTCQLGSCVAGEGNPCDDQNDCTDDLCDPDTGECSTAYNTDPCDDGDLCTVGDACLMGSCASGVPADCDDGNPCTNDYCDPEDGQCGHANGTDPCEDGDPCTQGDVCAEGACVPGPVPSCDDREPCTDDFCDPITGLCANQPNTATCDDGDPCTIGDVCFNGVCQPGDPLICDDSNDCTTDSCDPVDGCTYVFNEAPCSDGNACTIGDACFQGSCQPGGPLVCDDGNACTDDACDTATGCTTTFNTDPCDDGDVCTTDDVCGGGTCAGTAADCDDGNVCTDDSCDADTGECRHEANGASCDDGDACTTGDTCLGGACQTGDPVVCDDSNDCTDDSCSPATGECVFVFNSAPCDDGSPCTEGDTCLGGACQSGTAIDCDDQNECTDDGCSELTGECFNDPVGPGTTCDDGDPCTENDTCSGTSCAGTPMSCDDGNACTSERCFEGTCQYSSTCGYADWCRLQWPYAIGPVLAGTGTTVYGRVYEPGLTTRTQYTDPDPMLIAQVGWGPAGDPRTTTGWTWSDAGANEGYDGNEAGEPNNDEYMATLAPATSGSFDYAYRFSRDGGFSWLYCDRNAGQGSDGSQDDYQPANAGKLTVKDSTWLWCTVQTPPTLPLTWGTSGTVDGRVYVAGLTDQTGGVDPFDALVAQAGYGPEGSSPWGSGWTWAGALGAYGTGNDDVYRASIGAAAGPGNWHYAYRFSIDNGQTWKYCDTDGSTGEGGDLQSGYSPGKAGLMTVTCPSGMFPVEGACLVGQPLVISQVFGGGGNTGAPYKRDFIELHNRSSVPVSVAAWSVQYASATGTTWNNMTNLSGTVAAGGFFLVGEASGSNGADLPTPDVSGGINMSATAGKVALVASTTQLTGSCPLGGAVVDFVGYGTTANCFEGSGPTPAPSNTTSVTRKAVAREACQDLENNALDFTAGTVAPRNSTSPAVACP